MDGPRFDGEIIESTSGEVAADVARRGIDSARPAIVAVEPNDWIAKSQRRARPKVVAAGLSDDDIDRLIKHAQKEVEPAAE